MLFCGLCFLNFWLGFFWFPSERKASRKIYVQGEMGRCCSWFQFFKNLIWLKERVLAFVGWKISLSFCAVGFMLCFYSCGLKTNSIFFFFFFLHINPFTCAYLSIRFPLWGKNVSVDSVTEFTVVTRSYGGGNRATPFKSPLFFLMDG